MKPFYHIASADFLIVLVTVILIGAGGESGAQPYDMNAILAEVNAKAEAESKKSPAEREKEAATLRKKAEAGDAEAQYELGRSEVSKGGRIGIAQGIDLLRKAGEQGHLGAQAYLGFFYEDDVSVNAGKIRKNYAESFRWYLKAAEQGDSVSQFMIGQAYGEGRGVPKCAAKATEWWLKAGAQGIPGAWMNLGWAYSYGMGISRDRVLAYAWYNLAASTGLKGAKPSRDSIALTPAERAEGERLSSNWKMGQVLARESSLGGTSPAANGTPIKRGTGTLFVVSKTGHAITNQHVAGGCTELRLQGRDGVAKLVTEDIVNDLALVQIPGSVTYTAAIAAEPTKLRQGEEIVAFGFPLNSVLSSNGNITLGVVSAMTGLGNNTNQIQITAPIQPGSSGSPVLNKKGEVVGVVAMKLSDSKMAKATGQVGQNVNFAVSGQTLKTFLDTHKVEYRSGGMFSFGSKSTADLADEARKWTLVVECWK